MPARAFAWAVCWSAVHAALQAASSSLHFLGAKCAWPSDCGTQHWHHWSLIQIHGCTEATTLLLAIFVSDVRRRLEPFCV
eukprot:2990157-Pyramimonas_sp.AAC.2